ncbi:MAG: conserved hypothetical cytosolic protein [Magnetococcales bacterium]|nr:conserved hypothetical cytosolic protein [Magnetococcales bacterium]
MGNNATFQVVMNTRWTVPEDINDQLLRVWDQGRILAARFGEASLFPLPVRFHRPSSKDMAGSFGAVQDWIRLLEQGSRVSRGFGYDIIWEEINHRQIGRNALPRGIQVATEADALRLIGKTREAERFSHVTRITHDTFPVLDGWLADHPMVALKHADAWDRVLAILSWFCRHPRPHCYLRQVDIPGVDTKFIEGRRELLSELLNLVLPADAIDTAATGTKGFAQRFGLRSKPFRVRFRLLDPVLSIAGLTDLTVPFEQLAARPLLVRRVFITENEINGLAFPAAPESMVIFGLGYALDQLREISWLGEKEIHYWGDIDTHGFAILDRLRAIFPEARSFLMDLDTLLANRDLWGREEKKCTADRLERLTDFERSVFDALRDDHYGEGVRLEQERISFSRVAQFVDALGQNIGRD